MLLTAKISGTMTYLPVTQNSLSNNLAIVYSR